MTLMRVTPLAAAFRRFGVKWVEFGGWQVADNFGDVESEHRAGLTGAVVADWSMLSKFEVRGLDAVRGFEVAFPEALGLEVQQAYLGPDRAILRTTPDEFWLLSTPDRSESLQTKLTRAGVGFADQTGGRGALLLAGPERNQVLERATSLDLRYREAPVGSVRQGPVNGLRCLLLRLRGADLFLIRREFTESLFEGLLDVGTCVGVRPVGLACAPLRFIGLTDQRSQ